MVTALAIILYQTFFGSGLTRSVVYEGHWNSSTPTFDRGYLISWDEPTAGVLTVYGPDDQKRYDTSALRDSAGLQLRAVSAAVFPNGSAVLAYGGRQAHGLAFLDAAGSLVRTIATDPYQPTQVCIDDDGAVWPTGTQRYPFTGDFKIFRKYSSDGGASGAFMPQSQIVSSNVPYSDPLQSVGGWILRAAKGRIGAWLRKSSEWLELDPDGNLLGRWKYEQPPVAVRAFEWHVVCAGDRDRPPAPIDAVGSGVLQVERHRRRVGGPSSRGRRRRFGLLAEYPLRKSAHLDPHA